MALSLNLVISTFFVKMHCCFLNSFTLFDLGSLLENLSHMPPLTWFYHNKQFLSRRRPWIVQDLWKDLSGFTLSSPLFILNSPVSLTCPYFWCFFPHYKQTWPPPLLSSCTLKTSSQMLWLGLGYVYKLRSLQIYSQTCLNNCVPVKRKPTNVKHFLLFVV